MKSCPRRGETDRSTGLNLLLSPPIPIQGVVRLITDGYIRLNKCMSGKLQIMCAPDTDKLHGQIIHPQILWLDKWLFAFYKTFAECGGYPSIFYMH